MNLPFIHKLYAYNRWANDRTLSSVADLNMEEFTRKFSVSFGSVQGTLAHILGVEWLYLQRWRGTFPTSLPKGEEFPDIAHLRSYWQSILSDQANFLDNLTEEKLGEELSYVNMSGHKYTYPLADIMQHVVNHSTYHRGQVVSLLRVLDKKPLATDYLLYCDES